MKKFADSVKKFLVSEDGPTAVEYAVMLALIIVVCLAAISTIGSSANAKFEDRTAVEEVIEAKLPGMHSKPQGRYSR